MMELTDKMIEDYAMISLQEVCARRPYEVRDEFHALARALQAERAKPKDDLWKDAPEWATHTRRVWFKPMETEVYSEIIIRELPKTRAREIAEQTFVAFENIVACESAILKAQAEWEEGR